MDSETSTQYGTALSQSVSELNFVSGDESVLSHQVNQTPVIAASDVSTCGGVIDTDSEIDGHYSLQHCFISVSSARRKGTQDRFI